MLMIYSLVELQLTLWGKHAESFDSSGNPVIAIKGCKVSDYSGVSLGALSSSVVQINPDIQKCHELKGTKDVIIWIHRFSIQVFPTLLIFAPLTMPELTFLL